jgi:hypothetical protein
MVPVKNRFTLKAVLSKIQFAGYIGCWFMVMACYGQDSLTWEELASPEIGEKWLQPAQGEPARPIWGHVNGIQVGLHPMPGPRGLLRIYAPYLGHKEGKMINYIALEPIPVGTNRRGFSELEMSGLDGVRGKRFWSADDSLALEPLETDFPSRGIVQTINGRETLTVYIFSEPFDNGAKIYLRLRFYEDRPHEIELSTYLQEGSAALDHFILTATMGNFARLRTLYLQGNTKSSLDLWPDFKENNFTPHDKTPASEMLKGRNGEVYFVAAPDEDNPQQADYSPQTNDHWKYYGKTATQYWYHESPTSDLMGLVNGRFTYWASESPIPGGVSFENFELKKPFENGDEYVFGVSPLTPDHFVDEVVNKP